MSDGRRAADVIDVCICVHARPLGVRFLLEISSSSHRSSSDRRPDVPCPGVKVGVGITRGPHWRDPVLLRRLQLGLGLFEHRIRQLEGWLRPSPTRSPLPRHPMYLHIPMLSSDHSVFFRTSDFLV